MADKLDKSISEELKRIAGVGANDRFPVMSGKVKSINEGDTTCIVALTVNGDDDKTEGVMLNAVSMNNNGFILYPANNSQVWVAEIDGPGKWGIIKCSDLVKCVVKIGGTVLTVKDGSVKAEDGKGGEMTIENGKFSFKNGSGDMASIMSDILQHIIVMTMGSAMGPTTPPTNVADFIQDKVKLGLILE